MKKTRIVCSRGHIFYKSSDCPVCPICWPGYKKKIQSDFPKLAAPALRALANAKIKKLTDLSNISEEELTSFHGIGQNTMKELKNAMRKNKILFKD